MSRRPGYRFGEFALDPRLQRLTRDERIVPLKPKAYDLLCLLVANRERVVGKNELLDWLWPRQEIQEANLSQTVYELRRALDDTAQGSRWIENVPRRGYRFIGAVTEIEPSTARLPRSIAVLPFRALSEDLADLHLRLGVADSIILSLGATGRVVVRPLSATLRYVESSADALEIGRKLEVDAVLEGSVQRLGDRLRLSARLLRVPDGDQVWGRVHEYAVDEQFAIQDRIAAQVAEAIALSLSAADQQRAARSRPENPEVYALYLKGRYCWHRWTPESARQAVEHFQRAIAIDAGHAPSYAWLSAAWSLLGIFRALAPAEASTRARKAARRAIAIDETRPEGHEMQAAVELFFDWDLAAAARSLDRAIELDSDSSNARHLRALVLAFGGHNETALVEMLRALQADPSSLRRGAALVRRRPRLGAAFRARAVQPCLHVARARAHAASAARNSARSRGLGRRRRRGRRSGLCPRARGTKERSRAPGQRSGTARTRRARRSLSGHVGAPRTGRC
jgi:DNA-binding winged helix-turn-helix (wHTH) protein